MITMEKEPSKHRIYKDLLIFCNMADIRHIGKYLSAIRVWDKNVNISRVCSSILTGVWPFEPGGKEL